MNNQETIPPEVLSMPVSEAAHSLAAFLMESEDVTNYPAEGLALAFATGVQWEKAQAATHEPVLQAIGANLLQAPTKLTAGWVDAADKLLEQLLDERKHLYTDADGAWPAPAVRPQEVATLAQAVLSLNAAWNRKEPEDAIAGHLDLCRRLAVAPPAPKQGDAAPACSGCGSTMTDAELAADRSRKPDLISCCPDRKMVAAGAKQ